ARVPLCAARPRVDAARAGGASRERLAAGEVVRPGRVAPALACARTARGRARGGAAEDARGGARERVAHRRAPERAATGHRAGHRPWGGALYGAAQARRAAAATRRPGCRRSARRTRRPLATRHHAAAESTPYGVHARREIPTVWP